MRGEGDGDEGAGGDQGGEQGGGRDENKDEEPGGVAVGVQELKDGTGTRRRRRGLSIRIRGRSKQERDKDTRTINFGSFPEDTKLKDIITFMEGVLAEVKEDLEEVFAYGEKFAERGAPGSSPARAGGST